MQILDVLNARLDMAALNEQLEDVPVAHAKHALSVLFNVEDPTEILSAIEDATWLDKTRYENGEATPVREGIDNDGLTDAEASAALDEQSTWPQDEFGREIDPALLAADPTKSKIAMFAKVNGKWRFEGFMGDTHSVISQPVAEFRAIVEGENGPGTAFVVKLPS